MNFLQASTIVTNFTAGPPLHIRFSASGNVEPLVLYVRAAAAARGWFAHVRTMPFNTLMQSLITQPQQGDHEVILLMPWDLVPECDWRSGIPLTVSPPDILLQAAQTTADLLKQRPSKLVFLSAPVPPLYTDPVACDSLLAGIKELAASLGAKFLDPTYFALGSFLASGVPISGSYMANVALAVVDLSIDTNDGKYKILVTDLDNVLWAGLAAEDGPENIQCGPDGMGYRHFLYQGLLAKFKTNGVLLAIVSRNDLDIATAPLASGRTLLVINDFIKVLASYEPKSTHINKLAKDLNLGLDAFVFVDDNVVELAEVSTALPQVKCLQFPPHDDFLPDFFHELLHLFTKRYITDEDKQRTEMYRRRLTNTSPSITQAEGADLTSFLSGLQMVLTIYDRCLVDCQRAIQLINKTNQFNLNGERLTTDLVRRVLDAGGHLYTAALDDRSGSHGEILACVIDEKYRILSFVVSCRVFQRKVEHAFIVWLAQRIRHTLVFAYTATARNSPLLEFLGDRAFSAANTDFALNSTDFLKDHLVDISLFNLVEVGFD